MATKRGRVVALISSKGGVGKTTLAVSIAAELLKRGKPVTLIDADPQPGGGVSQWHAAGEALAAVRLLVDRTEKAAAIAADEAQDGATVLVDVAGAFTRTTLAILDAADLVLIPCRPSALDAVRAIHVAETASSSSKPKVAVVLNGVTRSAMPDHIRSELTEAGLRVLKTEIGQRTAFPTAILYGSAPALMGSSAAKAADEIARLVNEINVLTKA